MLKRKFDKMLTHGMGSQLLLLLIAIVLFFGVFLLISAVFGWSYGWQDIIALFLDPGGFGGAGEHDGFRLIITFVGIFLFSTLLISVFNNIFDNISESAKGGAMRYRVKDHILILGSDSHLMPMLEVLCMASNKKDIVIMTQNAVEPLSAKIKARFTDRRFINHIIFYRGAWDTLEELTTARPQFASKIYVIGEQGDSEHDSMNMRCCKLLKTLCEQSKNRIPCFAMMENGSTIDMYMKEPRPLSTDKLKIDIVNTREYAAEQVLAWTNFLPTIKAEDPQYSHFVILGTGDMAKAVAFTAAHNSHYPRLNGAIRRTRISILSESVREWMENLAAARPKLFERSRYTFIAADGSVEEHLPADDLLDVEWEFIEQRDASPTARKFLEQWALDREHQHLRIAICHSSQSERIAALLHLPQAIYDKDHPSPICIYLDHGGETAMRAMETGNYGIIKPFGPAMGRFSDPLFDDRSERGNFVNAFYLLGKEALKSFDYNEYFDAWYGSKESDKFASTYCANALNLRWSNFDPLGDREPIYEAEHRRWMMSKLLMGLEHEGIVAYDKVPQWKKDNFRNLIDCMIDGYKESGKFPVLEDITKMIWNKN